MQRQAEPETGTGWSLAMRAAEQASLWHVDEKHKDGAPFINHLIEVAALVTMATAGREPVLTAAAFLHDAVEKQVSTQERSVIALEKQCAPW